MLRSNLPGIVLGCALSWVVAAPALAQYQTLDWPRGEFRFVGLSSTVQGNIGHALATVDEQVLEVPDAAWVRLYFDAVSLEPGSFIRVTSMLDGEVQELDMASLEMWGFTSAFFNGDSVLIEIVAAPGTLDNSWSIDRVLMEDVELMQAGSPQQCGICGIADDRVPSDEPWTGRLVPAGCTASLYNEDSCIVSAGHCVGGNMTLQFNVPESNPNCSTNNPPVADQFPITSVDFANDGPGNDWSVMTLGSNNLGQTAFERQGAYLPIAPAPPLSTPQTASLTGYGLDDTCVLSSTQQTSSGSILFVGALQYNFSIDLRGGNSGSALYTNDEIIGIVTHCSVGCPNVATRIDHYDFVEARDLMCRPANDDCANARLVGPGTYPLVTVNASTDGASLPGSCDEGVGTELVDDVWFDFVGPNGTTTISTCGADFETRIAVYDACGGNLIACDVNGCGGGQAELSFPSVAGAHYIIRVGGVPGSSQSGVGQLVISTAEFSGACCIDFDCFVVTESVCSNASGTFLGDGVPCDANACAPPTGACCVGAQCFEFSEVNCQASGGTFGGVGTSCTPGLCSEPTGVCCLGEACFELTASDCASFGGTYGGDGSTCSTSSCSQFCAADITGASEGMPDGNVDALDFLRLISQWGSPCGGACDADITGPGGVPDGNVDALDYLLLIAQWGAPGNCG